MVMLVSLVQAKDHLRIDSNDGDNDLTLKVHAASGAVWNYINVNSEEFTDSSGDLILDSNGVALLVPFEIQAAALLMLGYLYRDRDADPDKAYPHGYLPAPVTSLLTYYHTPALR